MCLFISMHLSFSSSWSSKCYSLFGFLDFRKALGDLPLPRLLPARSRSKEKTHTHTYTCALHKQPQYKAASSKGWGTKGMLGELRRNFSCWGGGQGLSRIKINSHLQCTFPVSGIFCMYFNCMANGKEELGFRFCR